MQQQYLYAPNIMHVGMHSSSKNLLYIYLFIYLKAKRKNVKFA